MSSRLSLLSFFFTAMFAASTTFASYTVSSLPSTTFDFSKRTHIVLSGKGNDLGRMPILATLAKAKKYVEQFPQEQVFIINTQEVSDQVQKSMVKSYGFQIIRSEKKLLNETTLMNELVQFHQIASFNFFGHSGIEPGMFLDGVGEDDLKWRPFSEVSVKLKGHFTADAYAVLNGCNQGQIHAPILSKTWGIPVAGTFTSSHFEQLYRDGHFYWADDTQSRNFAPGSMNTIRMKPDDVDYDGYYGKYENGLGFFKFFCVGMPEEVCLKGIRASVYSIIGVEPLGDNAPIENYLKVVREWLCPAHQFGSTQQDACIRRLESTSNNFADRNYTAFQGHAISCTFSSCYPKACYASVEAMTACSKDTRIGVRNSTALSDEYATYIKAFSL